MSGKKRLGKLNPYWVNGFICGDGSFFVATKINKNNNLLFTPQLAITLLIRDKLLIAKIRQFFSGAGSVYIERKESIVTWKVYRLEEVLNTITYFEKYPLLGFKLHNYKIWKDIVFIIKDKAHLTTEGSQKIQELLSNLNKWD